jgi:hypothetical protein
MFIFFSLKRSVGEHKIVPNFIELWSECYGAGRSQNSLFSELVLMCTNAKLIFTNRKKKIPSSECEHIFVFNVVACWLRHHAASRKVTGSNPDEVAFLN